ncbi:MAG: RNA polymerase sporulation sigma factor SigK [Clostridia bacterium]
MQLFQFFSDLLFLAAYVGTANAFPEPLAAEEERDCIARMLRGDISARETLIEHNLRLVAHIAKKYIRAGRDSDDVISIGTIGLIKAVSTYDPAKGVALSSYASRCVENEILMSIRVERKQVPEVPLYEPIGMDGDGNDIALCDILGTDPDTVIDEVQRRLDVQLIHRIMNHSLTSRERTVIEMRFGLFGGFRMTQREVARTLGISRSYISRIEKKALMKLTTALAQAEG